MARTKDVKEPGSNREHVIEGIWATKALRIDGRPITPTMVEERMRDFYIMQEGVTPFAWGLDCDPWMARATAYGCCEFTVPDTWIQSINAHSALEKFFIEQLNAQRPADFTLRYTEKELRNAIRCIQRSAIDRSRRSQKP